MKKFLSLVMALVMTMSLVTVASAADYKDAADIDYKEAVDVMSAIGVLEGSDGKFSPKANLTRAQGAKIIAYLALGNDVASELQGSGKVFTDVPASHWAAGYIEYLAGEGIVAGVGNGKFDPNGALNNAAFAKMLLVVLGCDQDADGLTGSTWVVKVAKLASQSKIFDGVDKNINATATREQAAQYAFNALTKGGEYTGATVGTKVEINGATIATGMTASTWKEGTNKIKEYTKLTKVDSVKTDEFGRPAVQWKYDGKEVGTYAEKADYVFTAVTKSKVVAPKLEGLTVVKDKAVAEKLKLELTKDHEIKDDEDDAAAKAIAKLTANGKVVEVFVNDDDEITAVVEIVTKIVKVTNVAKDKTTTSADERAFTVETYGTVAADKDVTKNNSVEIDNFDAIYENIEKDDYVLVTLNKDNKLAAVALPTIVEGVVSKVFKFEVTVGGAIYEKAGAKDTDLTVTADKDAQKLWLDANDYIVKAEKVAADASDVVYLAKKFTETDKYNKTTNYAQIVTAEGELKEIVIAESETSKALGVYTYKLNKDDEAVFTAALLTKTGDKDAEAVAISTGAEIKADAAKVAGKYFADEVTFIYMDKLGEKESVKVTTAAGVQKVTSVAANSYAVLNDDGEVIAVFVAAKAENVVNDSDDLLFVLKTEATGNATDKDDKQGVTYTVYKNGVKDRDVMLKDGSSFDCSGFYSYSVDSKTGRYTVELEPAKVGALTANSINKDKYVTIDGLTDAVLAKDCAIYDLSDNGCTTLQDVDTAVEDGEKLSFFGIYDTKDEVFTSVYVVLTKEVVVPAE